MKLLIDQNISHRLKARITSAFPNISHVKDLGLTDFPDSAIFETARRDNFDAILTLDEDFHNLVLERGIPPKIVWLRLGNCSVTFQAKAILDNAAVIEAFLSTEAHDVLEIFR
jgi:predicted nuclease of predicted toxin-antitoxin system